jgi:hypothetical protein
MKSKSLIALLVPIAIGILLGACKSKSSSYELDRATTAKADSVKPPVDTNITKLVKTGDLRFKVKDVQQTSENITALTVKDNGMVMHHQITSADNQTHDIQLNNDSIMRISAYITTADMTVKIPSDKIEDFLSSVSHMSLHVNSLQMDINDRSLDYLASQLKLNNRRELVAQQKNSKVIINDPIAVLNLKDDMADEQVNSRRIDNEVKYSTISLGFYQNNSISKEIIANDDPSDYHLPFFSSALTALENGWYLFSQFVVVLINMWVFILIGTASWIGWRYYNKRKVQSMVVK